MGFIYMYESRWRVSAQGRVCINPYTLKPHSMSDIYSVASYHYFGGTLRMADIASG